MGGFGKGEGDFELVAIILHCRKRASKKVQWRLLSCQADLLTTFSLKGKLSTLKFSECMKAALC